MPWLKKGGQVPDSLLLLIVSTCQMAHVGLCEVRMLQQHVVPLLLLHGMAAYQVKCAPAIPHLNPS